MIFAQNFRKYFACLVFQILFPGLFSLLGDKFCNKTYTTRFQTSCAPCPQNSYVNCPPDTVKLTNLQGHKDCYYVLNLGNSTHEKPPIRMTGCRHTCRRQTTDVQCCQGFWGPDCNDCPGGGLKPCNNNGKCNDSVSGTGECTCKVGLHYNNGKCNDLVSGTGECTCKIRLHYNNGKCNDSVNGTGECTGKENFSGFACEKCANETLYSESCDQVCNCTNGVCDAGIRGTGKCDCNSGWRGERCDQMIDRCENITCDENSRCMDVFGHVMCACNVGFERDLNAENHTCIPINLCKKTSPCDGNATCTPTGPKMYNCTCNDGYYGDGLVCVAIDPCQKDYGGCDKNVSTCRYTGPGKHDCVCNTGYEMSMGQCQMIDYCLYNSSFCDENADCNMVAPMDFECTCRDGYGGNGRQCYNNLVDLVDDLNQNDPDLKSSLHFADQMLQQIYYEELRYHGPFTLFLPNDKGFRTILRKMSIDEFLKDKDYAKQILRQHIIVGEWMIADLIDADMFYTLQGVKAEINIRQRIDIIYRYRLHGSRNKGKIVKSDIVAANGIIHVINKFMTNEADIKGDNSKPVLQLIREDGRYNRFQTLVVKAGMEANFTEDNITVFAASNAAWDALPDGAFDYLQSDKGIEKLRLILSHQIFNGIIEVADIINRDRIKSQSGYEVAVVVTGHGQIQLDRIANISQADIPAQNGLIHHIDGLLLPMPINYILPSQCDFQRVKQIMGPCNSCQLEQKCLRGDLPTNQTVPCYFGGIPLHLRKCALICNRTVEVAECCPGFYGPNCDPCPGGFNNPCSGNGQCNDGKTGNGTCLCDPDFSGDVCDKCSNTKMFGSNCSSACTCVNGVCDNGINGNGKCTKCYFNPNPAIPRSKERYAGENCDKEVKLCGWIANKKCHIHSRCVKRSRNTLYYECICDPGYEGDGSTKCSPINFCEKPDRGGCHLQASCKFTGPGHYKCTCEEGWTGDGKYCYPGTMCDSHRDCDINAKCKRKYGHQKDLCSCNDGYHGNGTVCIPTNMCLHDNGGCHVKASCTPTGPGTNNCTCMKGYGGDGIQCVPTINQFVMDHPNLTIAANLLRILGEDNLLQYEIETYTFFVPTDAALQVMMARYPPKFFEDEEHITDFINFHTILGDKSLNTLLATEVSYGRFQTMYDGFYLHVYNNSGEISVTSSDQGKIIASVLQGDIPAINGFVNIIDRGLEPFISIEDVLTLDEFFTNHPDYSQFGEYLERKGLLDKLMDMNQYTLFAPTNEAMLSYTGGTVTTDFLSYYILPIIRLSASFDGKEIIPSLLGDKHLLKFTKLGKNLFVDEQLVMDPDKLTANGVVHGIRKLLIPVLHKCDVINITRAMSDCVPCDLGYYRCPGGYDPVTPIDLIPGCLYPDAQTGLTYKGCNGLCVQENTVSGCCAGYYGQSCTECPGGPEYPCNDNGLCDDGLYGNGTCSCLPGYNGTACEYCYNGDTKRACGRSCSYNNGGCHMNATCHEVQGSISCTCVLGHVGDGHTCVSPCEIRNGGCHPNAKCDFDSELGVNCTCTGRFTGDGRKVCSMSKEGLKGTSKHIGALVGIIIGVLILILIIIAVAVLFYLKVDRTSLLRRIRNLRKGSDSSLTFAPLHVESDAVYHDTTLIPGSPDVNFDNPLYSVKDQFNDDD